MTERRSPSEDAAITELLARWTRGDTAALEPLMELTYDRLHKIAAGLFDGERQNHTLQATAILNEAVLRLMDLRTMSFQDRGHFYAMAARTMRRVLVDHARSNNRLKRGGEAIRLTLSEADELATPGAPPEIEALDAALTRLEAKDAQKARIVELRFFVGLSGDEIANSLDISVTTVRREWRRARTWLYLDLSGGDLADPKGPGGKKSPGQERAPVRSPGAPKVTGEAPDV